MGDTYEEVIQVTMRDLTVQAMQDLQRRLDTASRQLQSVSSRAWSVRLNVVDQATQGVRAILSGVQSLVARGVEIPLRVVGGVGGMAKGVLGAFSPNNLANLGFATYGIQMLASVAGSAANALGFGLGTEMENTSAQMMAFTKDATKTAEIMDLIKTEAAVTPFSFQDMAQAAAGLLPVVKSSNIGLQDLMKQAEILSASNPMQGFEGAVFSLREAMTGDFTSITDRFNLSRASINHWKASGLSNFEIVKHAMADMGYDADIVARMGQTLSGRWSTFLDTIHDVQRAMIQPIFERVSSSLSTLQSFLDGNIQTFKDWGANIGNAIGNAADTIGRFVSRAWIGAQAFAAAWSTDEGAMGIVLDQIRELFGDDVANFIEPGVQAFMRLIPKIEDAAQWARWLADDVMKGDLNNAWIDFQIIVQTITGFDLGAWLGDLGRQMQVFNPTLDRANQLWGFIVDKYNAIVSGPGPQLVTNLTNVSASAGDVKLTLGDVANVVNSASGAVEGFTNGLKDAWHWLESHKEVQAALVGIMAMVTTAVVLQNVMLAIRTATLIAQAAPFALWIVQMYAASVAMGVLNAVMAINPFFAIALAIMGVSAALIYTYNTSEDFRNTVEPILTWLGQAAQFLLENAVRPAFEEIGRIFNDFKTNGPLALITLPARLMEMGLEIMNGLIKGFTGVDVLGWIRTNITDKIPDFIKNALGIHSPSSVLADIGSNMMQGLINGLSQHMPDIMSFMANLSNLFGGVGGDVSQWIMAAIQATGVPATWAAGLGIIIQNESGGNPSAANMWDVNAQNGDPSVGLMQLTGSNRARYTPAGLNPMDPVAQIIAGIRYIQDRYGDINAVPGVASVAGGGSYLPYDSGGFLPVGASLAVNNTGMPEPVLTDSQWGSLARPSVVVQPAAGSVVLQLPSVVDVASLRAALPLVADELWGLFGEHILDAAGNQAG